MQKIKLPDGTLLQFPDGMSDDEMAQAITENYPQFSGKPDSKPAPAAAPAANAAAPKPAAPEKPTAAPAAPATPAAASGLLDSIGDWYSRTKQAIINTPVIEPDGTPVDQAAAPAAAPVDPEAAKKYGAMAGVDAAKVGPDFSDIPVTPQYMNAMLAQWNAATPEQRLELAKRPDHLGVVARRMNDANPSKLPQADVPDPIGLHKDDATDPVAISRKLQDDYQRTAASDVLDPTADARARQLVRAGVRGDMANDEAHLAALRNVAPGQEASLQAGNASASDFDFETYKKFNEDPFWSNPLIRGAVKGYEGYKLGVLGVNQAIGELAGVDVSGQARMAKDARDYTEAMGERGGYMQRMFEGSISSIAQQLPALIGGALTDSEGMVLSSMFAQSFGQEYSDTRAKGQSEGQAATRAGLFGAFEVIGEKFGLGERLQLLKSVAHGVGTPVLAKWMANTLREELPGEMLTTTGEFLVDKEPNVGMAKDAGWSDYLQQMADTFTQTLIQGGVMSGATGGVHNAHRYMRGDFDRGAEFDAADAQRDALSKWSTNGLSPSTRPVSQARQEPSWASVANPGAGVPPAGRREPTIGDITSATSVDDAIAAANAVVNSTTPHATAADIDALEEQAGLTAGNLAAENQAASLAPAAEAGAEPTHDDVMGAMQDRAAEAAAARAPAVAEDPADWHPFPPEMRSMGVPRAQMPQILAEHRGAMVNFLNARGITHEHVEVEPESLRPTQREFSLSKVEKATDFEGGNRSILISSDNYVLDGHHQWMAAALKGEPVQAIRLNAPIKELVKTIHQFPSATVDTSSEHQAGLGEGASIGTTTLSPIDKANERIRKQEEVVRQAIEKQAAHRAGQAPQEPGTSIPTAAERAPAAPLPSPKPTAGQRSRERVQRENPFLAFLGEHGVHIDERSDTGGQKGRAGVVMIPGYGQLYRKKGLRLDELAQLAHEAGFLTNQDVSDPSDNAGTRKLAEMIQRAAHSKEAIREAGLLEAAAPTADDQLFEEAHARGIDTTGKTADEVYTELVAHDQQAEGRRETSGAETYDEQDAVDHYESQVDPQELADADIPFDLNDERLAPTNNLTDEQIDALFGLQKAAGPRADRGETEGHADQPAREGAAPAGEQGEAGQDLLSSYTPGEVVAREDAAAAREKATQAERDKLEAQRKKAQDEKEARARADSTVDDFQLGQDAHDQLSGQRGMFDDPAAKQIEKAEEAAPKHTYDPKRARPLLLIPCSDAKLEGTHKAIDLYKGVLYDVYRKYKPTENRPDVYILSAKHGIIHADTLLENYEQPMTPERLAELEAKPFDLAPFAGKNFNEVYIAGSAPYRQLGQRYVDELRQAGHVGPEAPVGHPPQGAGIGTQRGEFADYLRKVDMRGPANAAELSDQLDAEHAARAKPAEKAAPAAEHDDGSDIPHAFYAQVTVPHRIYSDDGKTSAMHDVPADVALDSVREDISSLEAMLKCMGA